MLHDSFCILLNNFSIVEDCVGFPKKSKAQVIHTINITPL